MPNASHGVLCEKQVLATHLQRTARLSTRMRTRPVRKVFNGQPKQMSHARQQSRWFHYFDVPSTQSPLDFANEHAFNYCPEFIVGKRRNNLERQVNKAVSANRLVGCNDRWAVVKRIEFDKEKDDRQLILGQLYIKFICSFVEMRFVVLFSRVCVQALTANSIKSEPDAVSHK